ncbi:unnamed protein product, partial [Ectocarpus sp. 13 AM-2016]
VWPDSLQRLVFGEGFNQPVDNVKWPGSLQEVTFGWCDGSDDDWMMMFSAFNQPIGSSVWPTSLRRLTLGGDVFSQSLQGLGSWMPNLEVLRLLNWTHPEDVDLENDSQNDILLRGIEWPMGLRQLTVFKEWSIDDV